MPSDRIVAFDLSTKSTGWASFAGDTGKLAYSHLDFRMKPNHPGPVYHRLRGWLWRRWAPFKPTLIAIERPIMRGANTYYFCGMLAYVIEFCHVWGANYILEDLNTIKLHATGNGGASKDDMVEAARRHWPGVRNDDEADALWLLSLIRKRIADGEIADLQRSF